MGGDIATLIWESGYDFGRAVLPSIREWGWLPPGRFVGVEDGPDHDSVRVVDRVAGIDGWLVEDSARLRGIASRIQYGNAPFESFTIRYRRPSGVATEFEKRLAALNDRDSHYVVPHYTIQAWVERRRTGRLLLAMMVETEDLYRFADTHRDRVERRRMPDGTEFLIVWASDLTAAGIDVRLGIGAGGDVDIRRRDGSVWNPLEDEYAAWLAEQEEDELDGYWIEDDDEPCAYCAHGVFDYLCVACGRIRP